LGRIESLFPARSGCLPFIDLNVAIGDQNATTIEPGIPRFAPLDAMRGIAVLAVACFHFHGLLTHEGKSSLFGPILDWVCQQGHLGAEVLFVISGFVLTHALRPLRMGPSTIVRFILRRAIRLNPTYWAVLLATFLVNGVLAYYHVIQRPPVTIGVVLANMFYLQEIVSVYAPVNIAWFLCAEVQFYLFFVLLLWTFQWLRERVPLRIARLAVFGPPALGSLLVAAGFLPTLRGIYFDHWHLFFLGTVLYWSLMGVISSIWFWVYMACMLLFCNGSILGGVGTGLAIEILARLGLLDGKQRGYFLRYVGSRSYSLYLVHVFVGSNVIRLLLRQQEISETFIVLVGFFIIGMIASFIAAEILFRLVERPSHRLARTVAWERPSLVPARVAPSMEQFPPKAPLFGPPTGTGLLATRLRENWPAVATAVRTEAAWLVPVSLFAAIWLTEMYVVQDLTLAPGHHIGKLTDFFAPKIRFLMDVCFVGATIALLGRGGLVVVAIGSSLLNLVLLTYYSYFYRPFSLLHMFQNMHEGMEMSSYAWDLLNGATVLSLSAVLVLKLLAIRAIPSAPRWRYPAWMGFFGMFTMAYVVLFILVNQIDVFRLDKIADRRTLGQMGVIRGYLGPWIAELYYLNEDRLYWRAIERREFKSDQLTPKEYPLPIEPRLVIIQVEALDYNVIGYPSRGRNRREVTPFLNQLREQSMFYRARVFRYQGSCDSDFTMMANVAATAQVNAYRIPNYPFEDANTSTLPQVLKQHGYETIALHGYPSSFYDRGRAYYKMGFKRSLFQEVLEHDFGLPVSSLGRARAILDEHVLTLSSRLLREVKVPTCHFIITLTSHTPYKCVVPREDYPYPRPANDAENYFNSIRYVDDCLRDYIKRLPKHTTVVIYGDHTTEVRAPDFSPDRGPDLEEYVPVFIYDADRDLAELQRTRDDPMSTDGQLNLLDISTFLRNRIAAVDPVGGGKPAAAGGAPDGVKPAKSEAKAPDPLSGKSDPAGAPSAAEPIARRQPAASSQEPLDDP
jgi:peptidoglycan/LPS O-acetylase OafA/YrhL